MNSNVTWRTSNSGTSRKTIELPELKRNFTFSLFHLNQLSRKPFNAIAGIHKITYFNDVRYDGGIPKISRR